MMWIYYGPHNDPHYHAYLPGMRRIVHPGTIIDYAGMGWPPLDAKPFEAIVHRIPGVGHTGLAFRERWRTQVRPDPVVATFIVRDIDIDPAEMLKQIPTVFPQVWTRFEPITIGAIWPLPSARQSEALASSTPTPAQPSKQAKPSAKSNA